MDAIKINQVAVDQLHPMLGDLLRSINRISTVKGDLEWKNKLKHWYLKIISQLILYHSLRLIELNKMRACEELSPDQARQFLFDLENAHTIFCRTVSE